MKTAKELLNSYDDIDKPWTRDELLDLIADAQRDAWEQGVKDGNAQAWGINNGVGDQRPVFPGDKVKP